MTETFFARLGGRAAVDRIIDGLYDRLEHDQDLRRLFRTRREGERARQKLFFEELFGGEALYTAIPNPEVGMQRRHVHRVIEAADAGRWLAHFEAAMVDTGVDAGTRYDVMSFLSGPAHLLVNPGAPFKTVQAAVALAGKGDAEGVGRLLEEHPGLLNQRVKQGVTMLWEASRRGRTSVVSLLLGREASVDVPGADGDSTSVLVTPLVIALRRGNADVAAMLRQAGARVDVFGAAFLGDIELLDRLLDDHPELQNADSSQESFYSVRPVHYAADGGSVAALRRLIERGAEVAPYGRRLLWLAARQGSLEMVELLLDHGADASTAEHLGPISTGDTRIARLLIAAGLNINRPVRGRDTFLCRVCRGDKGEKPATAQTLIDLGADVNARNYRRRTALHVAARAGFAEVIEVLLQNGASVDVVDEDGFTPINLAEAAGRTEAVRILRGAY